MDYDTSRVRIVVHINTKIGRTNVNCFTFAGNGVALGFGACHSGMPATRSCSSKSTLKSPANGHHRA